MRNKEYYEERFKDYPDLVNLEQFREMLGGIGDTTARKLMRQNKVKHFYIRSTCTSQQKLDTNFKYYLSINLISVQYGASFATFLSG